MGISDIIQRIMTLYGNNQFGRNNTVSTVKDMAADDMSQYTFAPEYRPLHEKLLTLYLGEED